MLQNRSVIKFKTMRHTEHVARMETSSIDRNSRGYIGLVTYYEGRGHCDPKNSNCGGINLKLPTPRILAIIYFFVPIKCTQYVTYMYLSPVTSYMFLCLLHHIQGDNCVTCSKICTLFSVLFGVVSKKESQFDYGDDETSLLELHNSYSFPSLSCLNFTCQFLFQSARLSIRTAEFSCYCCTFRVNIKL